MDPIFKPNSMPDGTIVNVEIRKCWGEKQPKPGTNYSVQWEYDITVNGENRKWYASQSAHEKVEPLGPKFTIKKISDKILDYYTTNGVPAGLTTKDMPFKVDQPQVKVDSRDDRILRAQCLNLSANLLKATEFTSEDELLEFAKKIYVKVHPWINE